jgi:DNA-binding response OmpR family regulator
MRILLIEDEIRLANAIKRGLAERGYAVDVFHVGTDAAEHAFVHHSIYDLIILDLMLPGRDGLDICRSLRERSITIPILILTAKDQAVDKITLLNAGADDYLTKPFVFLELLARIQALKRRPKLAQETVLTGQDLRLDVGNHKVFQREKELKLTVKEFAILEFFLQHPNEVIDRERILDHVWDFNFNSFSNVVDVHIKNLRRKLGSSSEKDVYIETVSGVGYRFKA